MSRISDIKLALNKKECLACKHCYSVGFNFYCAKENDKQISAMAMEDCYELDTELKARLDKVSNGDKK